MQAAIFAALVGLGVLIALLPSAARGTASFALTAAKPNMTVNGGQIAPTTGQLTAVRALRAHATWNRYGTPGSLIRLDGGYLATGLSGSPEDVARAFLNANAPLFKLADANSLQLVNDVRLPGTKADAILFAQRFGALTADWNGLIAVGVVGDKVAYVSSSNAASAPLAADAKLSPTDAWLAAAKNVGVSAGTISGLTQGSDGWYSFDVAGLTPTISAKPVVSANAPKNDVLPPLPPLPPLPGVGSSSGSGSGSGSGSTVDPNTVLAQIQALINSLLGGTPTAAASAPYSVGIHQGAKLVAFPTLKSGVRPAWLVNVMDLRGVQPLAYQLMVDAANGNVLFRHDAVQQDAQASTAQPAYTFTGDYTPPDCGPKHTFAVDGTEKTVVAGASELDPSNDIILKLFDPSGNMVGSSDTATSPEAVVYQAPGGADVATGDWALQVCPFLGPSLQPPLPNQTPPFTYVAAAVVSSAGAQVPSLPRPLLPTAINNNPRWAFFPSFPSLDYSRTKQTEGCWQDTNDGLAQPAPCQQTFDSPYSPFGWDTVPRLNQSTLTTRGNNAFTAEDWLNPLAPAEQRSPVAVDRYYDRNRTAAGNFVWNNTWNSTKCDPSSIANPTQQNADVDAATTNLFVMHNRMHDFAYGLGFTEQTYNAQLDNLDHGDGGTGPYPLGREGDPELGDAQAGAVSGGQPSLEGRDNANQITLNDGVPPITNQYLWQPIASAFYAPCTDGSFDLSVAGHEYTHLISNRMVGGPDASLSSQQGGSMGEAWSDLDALEYLHEYGLAGAQGEEPWSLGAYVTGNKQRGIRDYALDQNPLNFGDIGFDTTGPEVHADGEIWNGVNYELRSAFVSKYGEGTTSANIACAKGETPVAQCSGGRRWIQLVYDAWLLEQGDLSMVDARDAMLAADLMRFGGADATLMWNAFAHRGLGASAASANGDDTQPTPAFDSPKQADANVSFVTVAKDGANAGKPVPANVFVGDYEARVTPLADTDPKSVLGNAASFVPGSYDFVVQAPGYGLVKFSRTLVAGPSTLTIAMPTNWASSASDATATGDGVNLGNLIDDNEATNWASLSGAVAGKTVTIDLDGRHTLATARVSAMLHPSTCQGVAEEQGKCIADSGSDPDNTSQNRFTALRAFTIQTCDGSTKNCSLAKNWITAFDSAPDAFPGAAPRPVAPDLILRDFNLKDTAATMVRFIVKTNQCTGGPAFQGDQDNDPSNNSDCQSTANATKVRAAELELVSSAPTITSSGTTASAKTKSRK
ncbi:MAG TPA: M36 family metallopeptidase [Gaiellaceae bacterium]|nr:M36 family metallopeptidase [Gaiellaceae bacterium]